MSLVQRAHGGNERDALSRLAPLGDVAAQIRDGPDGRDGGHALSPRAGTIAAMTSGGQAIEASWFETRPTGAPHHEGLSPHPEEGRRPVSKDEAQRTNLSLWQSPGLMPKQSCHCPDGRRLGPRSSPRRAPWSSR